jgi:PAS domain S-box-containing protein
MSDQLVDSCLSNRPNRHGRILIVEDQGIVATDIQRCLEDVGLEVTGVATSMEEAIQEASASHPDLALMDIRIHGDADGIEAGEYLHRTFHIPVIYLTAHDDRDTIARANRTEPMAFLIKPFKPVELTNTVEIALKRSRSEREVREREQSFLSAMDAIGDAVLTTDSAGRVRFMNRAAEELTGWRQETALGSNATDVVKVVEEPGAGAEAFTRILAFAGTPESDLDSEYCVLGRDGVHHWLTIKATSIAGSDGRWVRVVVMQDITRRKQSEQQLRLQADLLDQAQDAIFTWDINGAITYWSRGAQAVYGFSPPEAVGRAAGELLSTAWPYSHESWEIALERDGRWSGEVMRKTKDGRELIVESLLVAVHNGGTGHTVLETDRDITERKRAELEIQRLNQELQARIRELTSVNQELESFNYSIAHDLRAPLRHIDAYTKLVQEQTVTSLSGEYRYYLERAREGAQRMGRMVDGLLELSRTSRREPARQVTNLNSLVEDVLFELKPEMEDREIEWRIGELPEADCDPMLTRQVFVNLLANALKFTRPCRPAVIEVSRTWSGGQSVLFVRDNGVGFSLKYADKLFGVFQRFHRREEFDGTGVGLATVQRIIYKHGGRIWAEAEPNCGATFFFTLSPDVSSPLPEFEKTAVMAGGR